MLFLKQIKVEIDVIFKTNKSRNLRGNFKNSKYRKKKYFFGYVNTKIITLKNTFTEYNSILLESCVQNECFLPREECHQNLRRVVIYRNRKQTNIGLWKSEKNYHFWTKCWTRKFIYTYSLKQFPTEAAFYSSAPDSS